MPTYTETMLTVYEEARQEASKISDREKLATYWLAKVNWFSDRFARTSQIETDLETMQIPVPAPLSEASLTLMRIVEALPGALRASCLGGVTAIKVALKKGAR